MNLLKFDADALGWSRFNSEQEFIDRYPGRKEGEYRPQPSHFPDKYPCYAMEASFHYNSNSPDEYDMVYIYDFEECSEQDCLAWAIKHS